MNARAETLLNALLNASPMSPQVSIDTMSDADLLDRALRGQEAPFGVLFGRHHGRIFRFAWQMSGSEAVADDVTQDTFLTLLRTGDRYDAARGSVAALLFGIARNLVLRHLERERRFEPEEDAASNDDIFDDYTRAESIETVRRAVLSLPPNYREVVVLCDLQEATYEDAAAALDCPVGTVRSRLNRARGMLAQKLCRYDPVRSQK
jgi:RNA polymerase sigma-70 factor, ECF subfamily